MWLLAQTTITHETLALVLLLGFLLLAGLCLSERVFTRLLALIASRGSSVEVQPPENPPPPTGSLHEMGQGSNSVQTDEGRSTSARRDT